MSVFQWMFYLLFNSKWETSFIIMWSKCISWKKKWSYLKESKLHTITTCRTVGVGSQTRLTLALDGNGSSDISVDIVMGLWVGQLGFNSGQGQEIFLFSTASRLGPRDSFQLRHEDDLSSLSSAKVKNDGAKPPLCHSSSWNGAQLIKRRNNFTFY
jgi:hypothetical protein